MTANSTGLRWRFRESKHTLSRATFSVMALAVAFTSLSVSGQNRNTARSEFASLNDPDKVFEIRYPKSLLVCSHRDGENPDVWSPDSCISDIPVCDNSGHAGNVLACLAYPGGTFKGSEVQAAAFSVSRIESLNADECVKKWARSDTTNIHSEQIHGLKFQAGHAVERGNSHAADESMYRIFHKGACYELDVTVAIAQDTAFAAEDVPRKLTAAEREQIRSILMQALDGFRFLQ
jgi:hypothetical protein